MAELTTIKEKLRHKVVVLVGPPLSGKVSSFFQSLLLVKINALSDREPKRQFSHNCLAYLLYHLATYLEKRLPVVLSLASSSKRIWIVAS